jgi:hypothetical protein
MSDERIPPHRYILAEFCAGRFYHGWGLYECEHNDGRADGNNRWLSGEIAEEEVTEMLLGVGYDPPPAKQNSRALPEWFAATFPNGLRVRVTFGTPIYELVRVEPERPRQRRGVIRTIRGAAMAEVREKARTT